MPGTLFLVATPIGNLEDITYRAVRTLREVSLIACEDTRQTRKLLEHYAIENQLVSYHEHNEKSRAGELIRKLREGEDVAVVSDAGTPLISDPGYQIVREAAAAGVPVVPVPGPSAALTALVASGLPSDSFLFFGFVPQKGKRRRELIDLLKSSNQTIILYESPHRILATLDELRRICPDRQIVAGREMTKLHEEFLRGTAGSIRQALAERPTVKGEFTIVVAKPDTPARGASDDDSVRSAVQELIAEGKPRMDAIKQTARALGLPKRKVYDICEQAPET